MTIKKAFPFILLLGLLGATLFANALDGEFIWDDKSYIEDSSHLRYIGSALLVLDPIRYRTLSGDHTDLTRPVMFLSLLLDYQLWGLNPAGYHSTNVLLHILSSLSLFMLALLLTKSLAPSFMGALIFLVHPVHVEAITGITFREDLLVTFFYIVSMIFIVRLFSNTGRSRRENALIISGATTAYFFALMSKEMAVTLPVAALLLYLFFKKQPDAKRLLVLLVPFTGITLLYLAWITGTYLAQPVTPTYPEQSVYYSLINIPGMIVYYLNLFCFPLNLTPDPGYPLATSLSQAILPMAALLIFCFFLCAATGRSRRILLFLMLWFFASLLPVLQIVPTYNMVAERFLYLPSAGLSLMVGIILSDLGRQKNITVPLFCMILAFCALVVERNAQWKDASSLWRDALKKNRGSYLARINITNDYFQRKDYGRAEPEFLSIIEGWPEKPEAYNNLSIIYREQKRHEEAESTLNRAISSGAASPETYYNLAVLYRELERFNEALDMVSYALRLKPELPGKDILLSEIYMGVGRRKVKEQDYNVAIGALTMAANYGYATPDLYGFLAEAFFGAKRYIEAIDAYQRILMVNKGYTLGHFYIGESYYHLGRKSEAAEAYSSFLARWHLHGPYEETARARIEEIRRK